MICKYCQAELRTIGPLIIVEGGSETSPITKTHVCDNCGASVSNRKSPTSGDCLLEVPKEYEFALDKFLRRIELLRDFEDLDIYPYGAHQPMQCTLVDVHRDFQDAQAHEKHGDCFTIKLCVCQRLMIYFDGHIVFRRRNSRATPWDEEEEYIEYFSDHNEAFEDLRKKLDNLLFGSSQFNEVHFLIENSRKHDYLCSGVSGFSRVETWAIMGEELDYPDRYTLFRHLDAEDENSGE